MLTGDRAIVCAGRCVDATPLVSPYVDAIPQASSSIADSKMEKSVGASTQPCLTPFVTLNDSETSPPTLTFAIIPVCSTSIIVVNFSGQPYFLSSCHSPVLPPVSNALLKSTNTMYSGRSCSMHFSCSCRRQNMCNTPGIKTGL